jgi:hypothetical protein
VAPGRLGHSDVADVGGCDVGEARAGAVWIINDMQLGPGYASAELRPLGAQRAQPKAGGINQIHGICDPAAKPTFAAAHQFGQQAVEHCARASGIGIGERRARHFASAKMIEPASMTSEAGFDRPQALAAGQLRVQQGDELIPRRQPTHLLVGLRRIHQPIQDVPRHELQQCMKYCIVVTHDVAFSLILIVGKTSKPRRIHAMRLVHQNRTGQPWLDPAISLRQHCGWESGCPA